MRVQTKSGKEINLKSYRWPPANSERRAVVFMIHGYGSHQEFMSITAKYLAAEGNEVFGIDMRGHGDSEGERGIFETTEQVYDD